MQKWGLFIGEQLMLSYPYTNEGYHEALVDAKLVFQETEIPHEIKIYSKEN